MLHQTFPGAGRRGGRAGGPPIALVRILVRMTIPFERVFNLKGRTLMTTLITRRPLAALLTGLFFCTSAEFGRAQIVDWTRQLGSTSDDRSYGVSADGFGVIYTIGSTTGNLGGSNAGGIDAYVSKYDSTGALLGSRQFGTSANDEARGVSADGLGNVYISGFTAGNLVGSNAGNNDAFVVKYNDSGALLWTRQFGTGAQDRSWGVSADGLGSVYVSGTTGGGLSGSSAGGEDAFLRKYAADGTLQWTRQLGTPGNDGSRGVTADGLGNVFIAGYTTGSLQGTNAGGVDAFVTKYDASGSLLWTRQQGTAGADYGTGVSADALGNVYVTGYTTGSLDGANAGAEDAFLTKYDASGNLQWTRQLGTLAADGSFGVSADELGFVYIAGSTVGSLGGPFAGGGADAFVGKYDSNGNVVWTYQLGTSSTDEGSGVSADGNGNVYVSGGTVGDFELLGALATYSGGHHPKPSKLDPFLVKLIPEPPSLVLGLAGALGTLAASRRRKKEAK